jgi:TRAP-type C4-dicarboxylate transport system substrate-binding protein
MQEPGHKLFIGVGEFAKRVNEKANGELVIDVLGGPSVMPTQEQGPALQDGVVDMGAFYGGWIGEQVPILSLMSLSPLTMQEQRDVGIYDLVDEESRKGGMFMIGPWRIFPRNTGHFYMYVSEKVEHPWELAEHNLTIATFSGMRPWVEALGMSVALMPPADRYSAMERGVAQGAANSVESGASFSYWEVVPYWIDHGVENINHYLVVNLDKWNSLPAHLQQLLINTRMEMEPELQAITVKAQDEAKAALLANGMEAITFSDPDRDWYMNLDYEARWKDAYERYPDLAPKYQSILLP